MSRFGISTNKPNSQNLVESTKIERITIPSKTDCRIEKERRKKHSLKVLYSKKVLDGSDDQLEKSGLSEEFGEPQKRLCYLSDGSQDSKKRKRDESPPAVESRIKAAPVSGNPLRIRLIFKKPKAESPSLPREDPSVCSTSGAELCREPVALSSVPCSKVSEPEANLPSTSSTAVAETNKRRKHKPSKEDRYNTLFDDWTPPPSSIRFLANVVDSSKADDDWLFGNRTQEKKLNVKAAAKTDEDANMSLHNPSVSSWPKAQFLSEAGIYSLPYTIPF